MNSMHLPARARRVAAALAALLASVSAEAATTYQIVEAIQFAPGTTSATAAITIPSAINRQGQMLGQCVNCNVFDPSTGTLTSVRPLADGSTLVMARGLNASGQVAGASSTLGAVVRNADGTVLPLGLPPGHRPAWANAINDSGVSVGLSRDAAITSAQCAQRALRWDAAGNAQPLGELPATPVPWSVALGLNSLGQAVGQSAVATSSCGLANSAHAVLFTPGGPKDLHFPSLPPVAPGLSSVANALNDQGLAVGHIPTGGVFGAQTSRAIVWDTVNDSHVLLGSGTLDSSLRGINNAGTVVGHEGTVAVVGQASGGPLVDLNTLVPGKPPGWTLRRAVAINDAGQIAVEGFDAARGVIGFVLTPLATNAPPPPAPSNLVAVAASATSIRLLWADNASDETSQTLTRCNPSGCQAPLVLPANQTSFTDSGLATGVAYSYNVRAQNAGGESLPSNSATATPAAPPPPTTVPAAPTGLVAAATGAGQVALNWTDLAGNETAYAVYRCQGRGCSNFSLVATLGANATTFVNGGLRAGTRYSFRVRASNSAGSSASSNTATVTTLP